MNTLKKIGLSLTVITMMISCNAQETKINKEESLVCKLTGAEQAERKSVLQEEIFSSLEKSEEVKMGYIFYFKYDVDFFMKMMDYVLAENNCCPFFTFEIKLHAENNIQLKITGESVKAKEMLKMVLLE